VSRGQGQKAAVTKARGLGPRDRGRCAHIFCSHRSSSCRRWREERGQLGGIGVGRRQARLRGLVDALRLRHLDLRCTRPAASASPPPARPALDPSHGPLKETSRYGPHQTQQSRCCRIALHKADDGPMRSAFENEAQRYPLITCRVWMKGCRVIRVSVNNQMTLRNVWGRPSRPCGG
jgi:hypothetical protein